MSFSTEIKFSVKNSKTTCQIGPASKGSEADEEDVLEQQNQDDDRDNIGDN